MQGSLGMSSILFSDPRRACMVLISVVRVWDCVRFSPWHVAVVVHIKFLGGQEDLLITELNEDIKLKN